MTGSVPSQSIAFMNYVQVLDPELAYQVQQPELPGRLPVRPSGHPAVQTGLPSEP